MLNFLPRFVLKLRFPLRMISIPFLIGIITSLLAGGGVWESIRIFLVLSVQILAGVLIFLSFTQTRNSKVPLIIGAGVTIGTALTTFSHQLLRSTPISSIAWFLPLFFAILIYQLRAEVEDPDPPLSPTWHNLTVVFWGTLLTMLGLADQWWWLYPTIFGLALYPFARLAIRFLKIRKTGKLYFSLFASVCVILGFATYWSVVLRKINFLWWILSYDIAYLESLSFSVNKWGPNENIGAAGTSISYHWFSLAWTGMTSQVSIADNWSVSTISAPILIILGIACLVYSCVYLLTESTHFSLLITAAVMLVRDVISVTSPSHLYAFLPFLLILNVSIAAYRSARISKFDALLVSFLVFCLFGSKVSTGATLVLSLGLFTVFSPHLNNWVKASVLFVLFAMTALSYQYFFGNTVRPASLKFGISDAGGRLIVGRPLGGGVLHPLLELFTQSLYFLPISGGLILLLSHFRRIGSASGIYLLSWVSISGFVLARFLDGEGTESYFMHVTFASGLILLGSGIWLVVAGSRRPLQSRFFVILIFTGLIAGYFRRLLSNEVAGAQNYSVVGRSLPYLIAYFFAVAIAIIAALMNRRISNSKSVFFISLSIVFGALFIGEQVERRVGYTRSAYNFESTADSEMIEWNFFAGSPDQQDSLDWIASNVPEDDIIATNRRCLSKTFCGPPKWMLVSALSKHRVLIEGNKTGLPDSTPWIDERTILSQRFISQPTEDDAARLYDLGVRYHYVELGFIEGDSGWIDIKTAQNMNWLPYAEVVHRNSSTLVLRLLKNVEQ